MNRIALITACLALVMAVHAQGHAATFTSNDRVIMTYFFYWYDVYSDMHIVDSDGSDALTDHPKDMTRFSCFDQKWYEKEFTDMSDAGIDVALPVYWGSDSEKGWSQDALPVMVKALDALALKGVAAPKIGMFYDTSALMQQNGGKNPDLRRPEGRELFYKMIKDFFSKIPQSHWAEIDGKAIVSLYTAAFTSGHNQQTFDYARESFKRDFGKDLFIIKEVSWSNALADDTYGWGAALAGPNFHGMAAVGPGYDDSAVPGRTTPQRQRDNGAFYEQAWLKTLARPIDRVVIETWNEFHEGTDIAESEEYGRQYIELTAKYAKLFKARYKPETPSGPYAGASEVSIVLDEYDDGHGITRIEVEDGLTEAVSNSGITGRRGVKNIGGMYIYFGIDDDWLSYGNSDVEVTVEYLDAGRGSLVVQYDSNDPRATLGGAYKDAKAVSLKNTGKWQTAKVLLKGAKFSGRQNGGADLRIALPSETVMIRRITAIKAAE